MTLKLDPWNGFLKIILKNDTSVLYLFLKVSPRQNISHRMLLSYRELCVLFLISNLFFNALIFLIGNIFNVEKLHIISRYIFDELFVN